MNKLFKSLVALCMVAVLAIGGAIPAMAAECEATDTEIEVVSTTDMESRAGTQVGGLSGTCTIKAGSVLGTCYVGTGADTIEVYITGVTGTIILYFDNVTTGDHRSLTVTGGVKKSLEYVSKLDSGDWECSVYMCTNNATNCEFDINFYK